MAEKEACPPPNKGRPSNIFRSIRVPLRTAERIMARGLKLLSNHTDETDLILGYLQSQILPKIHRKERLLDVGAGFGRLTLPLGNH